MTCDILSLFGCAQKLSLFETTIEQQGKMSGAEEKKSDAKIVQLIEEDDEFEEFEETQWGTDMEEKEKTIKQQWQDDWDVDEADDDFCNQLRQELQKHQS